ncbi:MAG: PQQ-dependent dehydrogenase, methanol/ethanol family [Rhodocyclaceae bacterium]|nr:PQQ-dependent dehydrogenase, methanol/ethanol family [Rhodocyclaceae bacterium]
MRRSTTIKRMPLLQGIAAALACMLAGSAGAAPPVGAMTGAEWPTALGTAQGTRYSSLAQINAGNAAGLVEEFSMPTGIRAGHQGQPLVVSIGGKPRMFVVTPYPNRLIALDTAGKVVWTYTPSNREYAQGVACCDVVNRGAAYAAGKVVYSLLDGSVVAVDASTGKQVWRTTVGAVSKGETLTGSPIIVGDKVIVGNAGAELGIRGWVAGLSLANGKLVWKAFNTGPDSDVKINASNNFYAKDKGTNLGTSTWQSPGASLWQQGGSTVWGWFTHDPDLKLVYYGTANPGVWNPDMRPGDNKWSATIFARDPNTGVAKWAYQLTPHDGWDFDAMNEAIVIPAPSGVATVKGKVLVHFNKNGFAYMLDAWTGRVVKADPFVHVSWASDVNLATGQPTVVPAMNPHEGQVTPGVCPSPLGGKEFAPAAYSNSTGLFYIPGINFCTSHEPLKAVYIPSTPFVGDDLGFSPDFDTTTAPSAPVIVPPGSPVGFRALGEFIAWDPATASKAWSIAEALPLWGGVLATAGNVVFYGTLDGWFRAVDARDGTVLMSTLFDCGVIGNPITYVGADGKQRVAVYSGIGWLPGAFAGGACPARLDGDGNEKEGEDYGRASRAVAPMASVPGGGASSGVLHVFRLP